MAESGPEGMGSPNSLHARGHTAGCCTLQHANACNTWLAMPAQKLCKLLGNAGRPIGAASQQRESRLARNSKLGILPRAHHRTCIHYTNATHKQ
jgi:hypothetical protein